MKRKGGWQRQSWQNAESEIGQALEPTAQPGEEVRAIPDSQIEDSPFQARSSYGQEQIAELTQGMRESGFQGVLFARPHPDSTVGRERYQLVYGHRRRQAWRSVCTERNQACVLPVIVRSFTDQQMLTIGAQENLQREDLNPLEEARLVLWHQEVYYPAGLREIGQMLGKSEDWAKTRARLASLPEELQDVIRRSPALMTGMLEIHRLWGDYPEQARTLALEAEADGLNLRQIRQRVGEMLAPPVREESHKQRVDTPIVIESTGGGLGASSFTRGSSAPSPVEPATRIAAEADRMVAQIRRWQEFGDDPDAQEAISRGVEQLLSQIQQLVEHMAADS
jgi:ParB/RepB/Spo0J family partition protein